MFSEPYIVIVSCVYSRLLTFGRWLETKSITVKVCPSVEKSITMEVCPFVDLLSGPLWVIFYIFTILQF